MGTKQSQALKDRCVSLILCALSTCFCTAQEAVHIPDPHLKAAIEDELWVWDPTADDMLGLTSLNLSARKIRDLTGLEHAKNLHFLQLTHNLVDDLSPLDELTNLRTLIPNNNQIYDLSPLARLTQLRHLDLHENKITSVSPLSGLVQLKYLNLHENQIRRLSGLAGLSSLEYLDLNNNPIEDLSPLATLSQLPYLNLSNNQLYDISALSGLTGLTTLYLYNNQISDISPLAGLIHLQLLSLPNNRISDISPLADLTHLTELYLNYNQITDISALCGLSALHRLWVHDNPLNPEACTTHVPQILANNPDLIECQYDACTADYGLIISSSSGGVVIAPGEGTFPYTLDSPVAITALAYSQYHFVSWTGTAVVAGKVADPYAPSTAVTVDGHYTLTANFADGPANSPAVSTHPAQDITAASARLEAQVVDAGTEICSGWFRYWIRGRQIQTEQRTSRDDTLQESQAYSQEVTGLLPDTTYCFHAVVENSAARTQGSTLEFTTLAAKGPPAREIHVDDDASADPGPFDLSISDAQEDGSADHPYDSIQEAIDQAQGHERILVHAGTYHETLNLMGKPLTVSRFSLDASDISPYPIIDAQNAGTTVTFSQGEDATCLLSGLVLTGGLDASYSAIACIGASPTIQNCLIVGNRSTGPEGTIIYCEDSHSLFQNVTVADNVTPDGGSAFRFVDSEAIIANSIIWGNAPYEITVASGDDPTVVYSDVQGNWPGLGNLAADPLFALASTGNTANEADTLVMPGDYHLLSETGRWNPEIPGWVIDELTSPCVDTGDPDSLWTCEPRPHGSRTNMGAYGGTEQASCSLRIMPITAHWTFDESSGYTVCDTIGRNDGTVYGATWAGGKVGGALQFDGMDDYVAFGNTPSLFPHCMTLTLWIHPQATSGSRTILSKGDGDKENSLYFELFAARHPTFSFGDGAQTVVVYASSPMDLYEWTHIALIRHDAEAAIYLNGKQLISKRYDFSPLSTDHSLIMGGGSVQPYKGRIDDVRIYASALSEEEISELATGVDE